MITNDRPALSDKKLAAVCGLYCGACSLYIATTEDPERLKYFAARFNLPEEIVKCFGCRSDKKQPFCDKCTMSACAAKKGVDFCVECHDYPCEDLKKFQSEKPHRRDLWNDLSEISKIGYAQWIMNVKERYGCENCKTINSAYDLKCRKCGHEPGSDFVREHKQAIEEYLSKL